MSPIIDLNVNYEDVKDEDRFPTVPNGDYDFTITKAEAATTQKGRPQIKWKLDVVNPENGKKVSVPYNTVLPWQTPDGVDVSGVGLLVSLCKSVGKPWTGTSIDPDEYVGRSGRAQIVQKPGRTQNSEGEWVNDTDPSNKVNDVKKFYYDDNIS